VKEMNVSNEVRIGVTNEEFNEARAWVTNALATSLNRPPLLGSCETVNNSYYAR